MLKYSYQRSEGEKQVIIIKKKSAAVTLLSKWEIFTTILIPHFSAL